LRPSSHSDAGGENDPEIVGKLLPDPIHLKIQFPASQRAEEVDSEPLTAARSRVRLENAHIPASRRLIDPGSYLFRKGTNPARANRTTPISTGYAMAVFAQIVERGLTANTVGLGTGQDGAHGECGL
jgi:hypothetical protein